MSDQAHDPTIGIITQRQEKPKYKSLTIQVPEDTDTSGIEGVAFPADMAAIATMMLRTADDAARKRLTESRQTHPWRRVGRCTSIPKPTS